MRRPDFTALTTTLMRKGIAPRHVHRTVGELRDHYDDLVDAAIDNGAPIRTAHHLANRRLGDFEPVVSEMASRRELKTWTFRYPYIAVVVYPLACLAVLPAVPVFAGIAHRGTLFRWGASLLGAGLVTACMLLLMQLSILFA